jgi:hypothetical protein
LLCMLRLSMDERSAQARACALACDLVALTQLLISHSALVGTMLRSEHGGLAGRLVAGVTHALACAPLHGSHEELVLAICDLIDSCCQVVLPLAASASRKPHELWARSLARKTLALPDRMVASWLLNPHVWNARQLRAGNVMSFVAERMAKWARQDPRRLLGNDDFAALFDRLLVLSNGQERLVQSGGGCLQSDAVESGLVLAVCSQLLHPSAATACGLDGSMFVRQSLLALARLVLAAAPAVKLVGLKLLGQTMITWNNAGQFPVLVDILGDPRLDWPSLILSIMHHVSDHCHVLGLALSTLATFLSSASVSVSSPCMFVMMRICSCALACMHCHPFSMLPL